jgi:hypothetical protein
MVRNLSAGKSLLSYLRAHPILCLLLLSPGIPEYLSGSSAVNAIILNPTQFVFQVVANLGLYGSGVILIREAFVRWKKGWASVLILGAAYGILEEGLALSTLYNPLAGTVGRLGYYGHYLGVSWIWVVGILPVHMIFSISIPILLLGMALPETNGKSLVTSRKGITNVFAILSVDVTLLFLLILRGEHFWMGWPVFIFSFAAVFVLAIVAKHVPDDMIHPRSELSRVGPIKMGIIGALFYTSVLLAEGVGTGAHIPALLDLFLVIAVEGLFLFLVLSLIGRKDNARQLIALSTGLVVPIIFIGFVSQITLPLVIVVDLAFAVFIWKLSLKHSDTTQSPSSPQNNNEDISNYC